MSSTFLQDYIDNAGGLASELIQIPRLAAETIDRNGVNTLVNNLPPSAYRGL